MNTLKFNQIEFNHIGEKPTSSIKLQEKKITIVENGTTEVVPDSGYALEKVKINTNIKGSGEIDEDSEEYIEYFNYSDIANLDLDFRNILFMFIVFVKYDDGNDVTEVASSGFWHYLTEIHTTLITLGYAVMPNKKIRHSNLGYVTLKEYLTSLGVVDAYNNIPRMTKEQFYDITAPVE